MAPPPPCLGAGRALGAGASSSYPWHLSSPQRLAGRPASHGVLLFFPSAGSTAPSLPWPRRPQPATIFPKCWRTGAMSPLLPRWTPGRPPLAHGRQDPQSRAAPLLLLPSSNVDRRHGAEPEPPSLVQRSRLLSPSPIHGATLSSSFFPLALAPCRRAARPLPPCAAALPTPPWSAQGPSDPSSSSELTVAHGAPTPCYTFSRPPLPSSNISFPQTTLAMAGALRSASAQLPLPQPHNVGASRVFDEMLG